TLGGRHRVGQRLDRNVTTEAFVEPYRFEDRRHLPTKGQIVFAISALGDPRMRDVMGIVTEVHRTLLFACAGRESEIGVEVEGSAIEMLHAEVVLVTVCEGLKKFQDDGVVSKRSFAEIGRDFVESIAR